MKKLTIQSLFAIAILATASSASAWWGGNNNGWGNSYDEWDPRYWAEEMEDFFGNNDDWRYGPRGYAPYGTYGYAPYGNAYAPTPYGTVQPAPYGYNPQGPVQQ